MIPVSLLEPKENDIFSKIPKITMKFQNQVTLIKIHRAYGDCCCDLVSLG